MTGPLPNTALVEGQAGDFTSGGPFYIPPFGRMDVAGMIGLGGTTHLRITLRNAAGNDAAGGASLDVPIWAGSGVSLDGRVFGQVSTTTPPNSLIKYACVPMDAPFTFPVIEQHSWNIIESEQDAPEAVAIATAETVRVSGATSFAVGTKIYFDLVADGLPGTPGGIYYTALKGHTSGLYIARASGGIGKTGTTRTGAAEKIDLVVRNNDSVIHVEGGYWAASQGE
jgi:hypothetical protein